VESAVYRHKGTTGGAIFLFVFLVALVLLVVSLAMRSLLAVVAIFMAPPIMVIALVSAASQLRLKRIVLTEEGFYFWVGGKKRFKAKWATVESVANADPAMENAIQAVYDTIKDAEEILDEDYSSYDEYKRLDFKGDTEGVLIFRTGRRTLKLKPGSHFGTETLKEIFRFARKMQKRYPNITVKNYAGWK
jgi:hypothetical protein